MALDYICTSFENASPLDWETDAEGRVRVGLLYDHERGCANRAAGHWHFQLQGQRGTAVRLRLENFDNIWNGRHGSPLSSRTSCFVSPDGAGWSAISARTSADNCLELDVHLESDSLYLARLEPYRLSDLQRLLREVAAHPLVAVTVIGSTVEGRDLEIVRIGREDAPNRVLIRARSHPWEPGGSWLVQGLIRSLLRDESKSHRCLERCCLYVLPMAAKDGVVRGRTRFNEMGMDLNRGWERTADLSLAPENHALEEWLAGMTGCPPDLALDLHNDNSGRLHVSHPAAPCERYLANMRRLEALLRRHTWFTEGSTGAEFQNPGTFGEGLLARYGIDACILELNCDWIAGLRKVPFGSDWEQLGARMRGVFADYFSTEPSLIAQSHPNRIGLSG